MIEDFDPPEDAAGHEARRRYYRITSFGRRVAAAEAERLVSVVRLAPSQAAAVERLEVRTGIAQRLFRLLVAVYPRNFRSTYADDMALRISPLPALRSE